MKNDWNKFVLSHDSLWESDDISVQVAFVLSTPLEWKVLNWINH